MAAISSTHTGRTNQPLTIVTAAISTGKMERLVHISYEVDQEPQRDIAGR